MEDARGLELRNTTNVVRVQVPFTAIISGRKMAEPAHDFSRLQDLASCPPREATPVTGTFYAFHGSDPPDESDFRTSHERGVVRADPCKCRANSIWSDLEALKRKIGHFKRSNARLFQYISAGDVCHEHGVCLPFDVEPEHCSFWICGKTSMRAIFKNRVV
jgi:hypothetical protein